MPLAGCVLSAFGGATRGQSHLIVSSFMQATVPAGSDNHAGREPVGELTVDVSETADQAERPLTLLLDLGRSQIQVEAIDLTTSKKFQAAIGFEQVP
jgi:hypothetical protein